MMDNTTKFWISSKVSRRREVEDARVVFQDAKSKTPKPIAIVHDGLPTYNEAYWKEYYEMEGNRVQNIRSVSERHQGLNQTVERLNGIVRDREKVMRGMDHRESAQKLIDAIRIHYNFVREHNSIKKTPAEQAAFLKNLVKELKIKAEKMGNTKSEVFQEWKKQFFEDHWLGLNADPKLLDQFITENYDGQNTSNASILIPPTPPLVTPAISSMLIVGGINLTRAINRKP
jgi:hypothetical protein